MWLSEKEERKTLAFYYRQWNVGKRSFPCKEPMNEVVNRHLEDLELIKTDFIERPTAEWRISLTFKGIRLGEKYNSCWSSSGQWFAEYKDHWFWLILSFLGGVIGALLVNWLSSLFTKGSGC